MIKTLLKLLPAKTAYAHCDIPCGIYDPHNMQMAAHTIIRMVNMINDLTPSSPEPPFDERKKIISQVSRLTRVKEEHAELLKHEVRVLYGDYFKEEHLKEYPELQDLVFKTLKLASKARQNIDMAAAEELLANIQQIAEIFYKSKGMEILRVKTPYPTGGELIIGK